MKPVDVSQIVCGGSVDWMYTGQLIFMHCNYWYSFQCFLQVPWDKEHIFQSLDSVLSERIMFFA